MPDLSDAARKALAYWPQIEYAAAAGMNTADLWSAIRDAAEELGLASPGVSVQGVSQLRGLAAGIQRGAASFERLADNLGLGNVHVAQAPWSRSLAEQAALPMYHVRYQHTVMGPEGPETNWRTSVFTGPLPDTVGGIRAAINEDAAQLANKYGVAHGDVAGLQILSV